MRIERLAIYIASITLASLLAGCGSHSGSGAGNGGPAGGGGAANPAAPGPAEARACLLKYPKFQVANFADMAEAVGAFAEAQKDCGASLADLRREAELLQSHGTRILKSGGMQ